MPPLELADETQIEAPRLLRDQAIKHYRLFPFELRKVTQKRAVRGPDGTDTEEDEEIYEFSVCSDRGIERYDWWTGDSYLEVLSHEKGALVSDYLDAGASFLLNHRIGQLLGRIRNWRIDGKKEGERQTIVGMRWSPLDTPQGWGSPQGIKAEVDAGVRGFTSIGYEILAWEQTKKGDRDKGEMDVYTCTKFRIFEASIVDIPADITTGRSRARFRGLAGYDDGRPVTEDERDMEPKTTPAAGGGAAPSAVIEVDAGKVERERASAIVELGRVHKMPAEAEAAVRAGDSVDRFRAQILERISTQGTPQPPAENAARGLSLRDRKKYSYRRALLQNLLSREGEGKLDGVEGEMHQEIRKSLPDGAPYHGGVLLPTRLFDPEEVMEKRAFPLDSATSTEGAEFKYTQPMEFIEMLRTRLAIARLGARILTGLIGPLSFPRQTAAGTASWVAEEAAVSDSMAAFDTVTMAAKTLMSSSGYTRQLLEQTSYDIEGIVRADLAAIHARAIDFAGIQGTGTSNQPRGVANQSGVLVRDCGAGAGADAVPDLTDLVSMIGLVADANADYGALGFLTTPLLAATLSRSLVAASAGSEMLWMGRTDEGTIRGYRAIATNQVAKVWNNGATTGGSEHGLLFGNWNELMVGLWNAMEAIVDPYSQKKSARIEITTFQLADIAVRHPVSFCIGTNAIP